ncbi:hypothetical protein EJ04DRAFT_571040 [Polyplosphaeria fusca]|uniref:Uncharacterized protein n=1 Tax=Polyplosphaeria fusca TaxID=682080 RepID=A0A9P4QKR6_9PLEO|nr:hypothetical protein EJ04DRAFT_571040 [Polyplosphaeria fusca]
MSNTAFREFDILRNSTARIADALSEMLVALQKFNDGVQELQWLFEHIERRVEEEIDEEFGAADEGFAEGESEVGGPLSDIEEEGGGDKETSTKALKDGGKAVGPGGDDMDKKAVGGGAAKEG